MQKYIKSGILGFKIDSDVYYIKADAEYCPGYMKREPKVSGNQHVGWHETWVPSYIQVNMFDTSNLSLDKLFNLEGATVTLQLGNGKVFALHDAYRSGEPKVDAQEGMISVRFEGLNSEELPG